MYLPKSDIYAALATIPDVTVRQASQKVAGAIPSITFFVSDNALELNLDNEIARQDILITVDIFASNSANADNLLSQVEQKLRELGYRLSFVIDVPDPENIMHINSRFTGIK